MEEESVAPEDNSQSETLNHIEEEPCCEASEKEEASPNNQQSTDNNEEVDQNQWVNDEEQSVSDATQQEIQNSPSDSEGLSPSDPPKEEQVTPPPQPNRSPKQQSRPSEPCWYCLRSLDSQYRPQIPKQEETDPSSTAPSGAQQRVMYQTDPRPHFGVAWSSHAPGHALWDSEGPCWGQRNQEVPNPTHICPHCHLGLPADTLRWHEAKCLLFEELRSSKK